MPPVLSFTVVIFFFIVVVGFGGLFLTTSAICGMQKVMCPNGDLYGYPFSDYVDSNGDCGYPGLTFTHSLYDKVSRTVFHVSNDLYCILSKDEQTQKLRVVEVDVVAGGCPRPMHNFTLPTTSAFSDPYEANDNITYFYNCSSGYPKDVEQGLPCLDTYYNTTTTPGLRSFAFSDDSFNRSADGHILDERFNWFSRNCQESVVVPVQIEYKSLDLQTALKMGFNLYWLTPEECKDCEISGGQCWFNHTTAGVLHYDCSCPQQDTYHRKLFDKVCPSVQNTSQPACKVCEKSGGQCWFDQTTDTSACSCPQNGTTNQTKLFDKVCPQNTSQQQQGTHQTPDRVISTQPKIIILGVCSGVGGLLLVTLFICRQKLLLLYGSIVSHWDSKIKSPTNMEAFLESCGCPGLQKYKYSEVKKMTNTFKEKLGQGGFGTVFKGKLRDGRLVAVKVLDESKGNGEDFINEVATIGWTNHVNVVRLLGFCCNGNKRALVYEFMPNGSLDKFIYNRENTSLANPHLEPEKLYQIALGIAKGLEYLHCGCNTRILHFDIKPHNILLDQDFCPKISDFGLAKLCQTRESIVSMHMARGTMGYIAPEVACINFGGVSHKSDVYSYGMMILEMIGGRKNIDATVENISEIYFPKWIYNHFIHDTIIEGHKEIFKEENTRKMVIVALHSIQAQPVDRPSISKIVEMLEGNVDELQIPPNPFQDPP